MSRIGKMVIPIPGGVQASVEGSVFTVKGPKGTLSRELHPDISVNVNDGVIVCERHSEDKDHRSLHGLVRSLVNNMVIGVAEGYMIRLEVQGVGYRAELQGQNLNLSVGYAHPLLIEPKPGITFEVGMDTNTRMPFVIMRGIDKETIGQQAAEIRRMKPPEPYKGKGIRYAGEKIRRKAGKSGKAAGKK